jgi:hypothetical protein
MAGARCITHSARADVSDSYIRWLAYIACSQFWNESDTHHSSAPPGGRLLEVLAASLVDCPRRSVGQFRDPCGAGYADSVEQPLK